MAPLPPFGTLVSDTRTVPVSKIPFGLLCRDTLNVLGQYMSQDQHSQVLLPAHANAAVVSDAIQEHCGYMPVLPVMYPYPQHWTLYHRWVVYDAMVSVHHSMLFGVAESLQYWLSDPQLPMFIPLMPSMVPVTNMDHSGLDLVLESFRSTSTCVRSCILAACTNRDYLSYKREHDLVHTRLQLLSLLNSLELLPDFPVIGPENILWQIK